MPFCIPYDDRGQLGSIVRTDWQRRRTWQALTPTVFEYGLWTAGPLPLLLPAVAGPEPGITTLALPALGPAGRAAAFGVAERLPALAAEPLLLPGVTMGSLLSGADWPEEVDAILAIEMQSAKV